MNVRFTSLFVILFFIISCSETPTGKKTAGNDVTRAADSLPIKIEIFGEQFKWTARYSGGDNELGKFDYKLATEKNPLGLMTSKSIDAAIEEVDHGPEGFYTLALELLDSTGRFSIDERRDMKAQIEKNNRIKRLLVQMKKHHDPKIDMAAQDDLLISDTLVLCKKQMYQFNFRSKDVIHSAYFPYFKAQMNAVPGMTTRFEYTPEVTTEEMRELQKDDKFEYKLICNKICGKGHYSMKMVVRVLDKKQYQSWIKRKMKLNFGGVKL